MQVYNISNQIHDKMTHNANQPKTFREEFATMQIGRASCRERV